MSQGVGKNRKINKPGDVHLAPESGHNATTRLSFALSIQHLLRCLNVSMSLMRSSRIISITIF